MKKVISYCLWGDIPKYTIGAIKNAEMAKDIYPGWICRFYVGTSTPDTVIKKLSSLSNTELFIQKSEGNWEGMFWRFEAISDPDVGVMLSRDCDSRLTLREKAAVDAWLGGDKNFHIMRDHPFHQTEILGGMWGCRKPLLSNMRDLIKEYTKKGDFWQVDQNFLREIVYPLAHPHSCVHDEFFAKQPFPVVRNGMEFVGQVFDENENTPAEHLTPLKQYLENK
jgi:hypothetical protein